MRPPETRKRAKLAPAWEKPEKPPKEPPDASRAAKLTPVEHAMLASRLLVDGEAYSAVAKDVGITAATLRRWYPRTLHKLHNYGKNIEVTPVQNPPLAAPKNTKQSLMAKLQGITDNVADTALYGAQTGRHLAGMAHKVSMKVVMAAGEGENGPSMDALRQTAALTRVSNDALAPALALLRGSADQVGRLMEGGDPDNPTDGGGLTVEILRLGS